MPWYGRWDVTWRASCCGDQWIVAAIGGVGSAVGHHWDRNVADSGFLRGATGLNRLGAVVGSFPLLTAEALVTYGVGRASGSPRVSHVGAELFRAQLVAQGVTQVIKFSVDRTRPDGGARAFPSGHSSSMFAAATVLAIDGGWKAGLPAYSAATVVALTRIGKHRHYVSDVIAGATIGLLAGRAVTLGSARHRMQISPMFVPAGIGVVVSARPARAGR